MAARDQHGKGSPWPEGFQLIGKPWGEADLLCAAEVLESRSGFDAKPSRWW